MELLENGDTDEVGITDFLVLVEQFCRDVRLNPLAEDLECFADRERRLGPDRPLLKCVSGT